jgi:hypothetical protein
VTLSITTNNGTFISDVALWDLDISLDVNSADPIANRLKEFVVYFALTDEQKSML